MRYQNLTYGNPTTFTGYATGVPLSLPACRLRRDDRTVRDGPSSRTRVPWSIPEILWLEQVQAGRRHRQMLCTVPDLPTTTQPGIVTPAGGGVAPPLEKIA